MFEGTEPQSRRAVAAELGRRLREPAPGRLQVLTGPRQGGKTTLLLELCRALPNVVYQPVDAPEAALPGWWEAVWREAQSRLERGPVVVLLDEIQYLGNWPELVKTKVDQIQREKRRIHLVLSGSSALLTHRDLPGTMAGCFDSLQLSHWAATDLQKAFGLGDDEAVDCVVRRGGYPGAFSLRADVARWRTFLRENVVEPAIGLNILMLEPVRRPAWLRQLFLVCLNHPVEVLSLQKLANELHTAGALATVANYLEVLAQAYLVAGLEKFSASNSRLRAAPPKILVLNNALLAALGDVSEGDARWQARVENACLAHAWNHGQRVYYWREEPLEVDGVLVGDWGKWAIEVKTSHFGTHDLSGLMEFCRRHPDFQPLVLGSRAQAKEAFRDVQVMYWGDFLLGKPLPGTRAGPPKAPSREAGFASGEDTERTPDFRPLGGSVAPPRGIESPTH